MTSAMWTSKLGNRYPKDEIERQEAATLRELKRLRGLKRFGNHRCADCGVQDNSWASVSHGVFICVTCSDVHRSVGTHVSKVKGCSGTYLWGPDEIELMQTRGNHWADEMFGAEKVASSASKEEKQRFVLRKYRERVDAATAHATSSVLSSSAQTRQTSLQPRPQPQPQAASPAAQQPRQFEAKHVMPLARRVEIADAVFEDLFGEMEQQEQPPAQVPATLAPLQRTDTDDLEAFLESALGSLSTTHEPQVQKSIAPLWGLIGN